MKNIGITLLVLGLLISFANAGVMMKTQFETANGKITTHTAYAVKDKLRMDITEADKPDQSIIFLGDKETFLVLNHKEKSYTELTKEDLEKMAKMIEQVSNMASEMMGNISPSLKSKMDSMMKSQVKSEPKIIYKKVATDEKMNQWTCDRYDKLKDDEKVAEIWTVDPNKLGINTEDLAVFSGFSKFFQTLLKNIPFNVYEFGAEKADDNMFAGIPVKTISYDKDKVTYKSELKELKQEELKPALFEIPKGYQKEKSAEDKE